MLFMDCDSSRDSYASVQPPQIFYHHAELLLSTLQFTYESITILHSSFFPFSSPFVVRMSSLLHTRRTFPLHVFHSPSPLLHTRKLSTRRILFIAFLFLLTHVIELLRTTTLSLPSILIGSLNTIPRLFLSYFSYIFLSPFDPSPSFIP